MKGFRHWCWKKCLHWDPDGISHLETLGLFAFSLKIPIVYSAARGRAEIKQPVLQNETMNFLKWQKPVKVMVQIYQGTTNYQKANNHTIIRRGRVEKTRLRWDIVIAYFCYIETQHGFNPYKPGVPFWGIGKQCRPRSECGVWSLFSLFANRDIYSWIKTSLSFSSKLAIF